MSFTNLPQSLNQLNEIESSEALSDLYCILNQKSKSLPSRNNSIGLTSMMRQAVKNQYENKCLGVLTSGGDSQGMNAALRAIVRMGIYLGCRVYLIHEGFRGLVYGENNFELATWSCVSGIVGIGGTIIGSARCDEFRQREGRLRAAKNLIKHEVANLVCIGGDGTLTGVNIFHNEWQSLLNDLVVKQEISDKERSNYPCLNIVGLVGSIDNDFCGTDMTIGADSALHRIIESIDSIVTTALSHQRCFVLEVMGRHCGYLALISGLASEADWILLPENPPEPGWEDALCKQLAAQRQEGHRLNIIIVCEGAVDTQGNAITAHYVRSVVEQRLKIDTRVTTLGHVQRGGTASAYDRMLATRLGSEAVLALMHMQSSSSLSNIHKPIVIAVSGNQTCYISLEDSVARTQQVNKAIKEKNFSEAIELRGASFQRNLDTYISMSKIEPTEIKHTINNTNSTQKVTTSKRGCFRFAVLNLGAPASGVNSAVRSFVRHAAATASYDYTIECLAVQDGFEGLAADHIKLVRWKDVYGWTGIGGSLLGCQRVDAKQVGYATIAAKIKQHRIDGILLVGGFEAFSSICQLKSMRYEYKEFCVPLVCIPATISNNVPGTDFTIGCDTALNEIVQICDKIKLSAMGSKRRVFLVETMGGYCGYLASLSALAGGADASYIFEEAFSINDLIEDVRHLKRKMQGDLKRGLLVRNESANRNYTAQFMQQLMSEEGKGVFSARLNILGHMQQGGSPSPFDRNLGIKFGAKALHRMCELANRQYSNINNNYNSALQLIDSADTCQVIGLIKNQILFTSVDDLIDETDFVHRIPKKQWWLNLRPLIRILGKQEALYTSEIADNGLFIEDRDESEDDNYIGDNQTNYK